MRQNMRLINGTYRTDHRTEEPSSLEMRRMRAESSFNGLKFLLECEIYIGS